MTRAARKARPATLPIPTDWRDHFKAATLRTSFVLTLTRPMLEFLCATADDCWWDRSTHGTSGLHYPDNWIASSGSLEKRGLIVRMPRDDRRANSGGNFGERALWRLTPAGEKVVELLKLTGMFIESDFAISKKARKA